MPITLDGTLGITTPGITNTGNESYAGTLTGGTGVVNIGSGQFYKDASGNVGIGTNSPATFGKFAVTGSVGSIYFDAGATGIAYSYNGPNYISAKGGSSGALVFETGGANERMRIDSSGNVGIGTSSPTRRLQVYQTTGDYQARLGYSDSYYYDFGRNSTSGLFNFYGNQSGATGYIWGGVDGERMRIDSSGNVGIGTSSPAAKLQVTTVTNDGTTPSNAWDNKFLAVVPSGTSTGNGIGLSADTATNTGYITAARPGVAWSSIGYRGLNHLFYASGTTEAMRIDSSGNLLVGQTSVGDSNSNSFSFGKNGWCNINHVNGSGSGTGYVYFGYNGSSLGSITQNGTTAIAYNTTSDYRLKENVAPMQNALATVQALKPVTYNWKADGSSGQGFIAHELQAVVPDCVTGEKDAVDEDGNPKYQGIDTSFLVATLTAAIQEQQAMIEELTTRLNALEGK